MKKHLLVFLVLISMALHSQVWISKNAVWHYNWTSIGWGGFIKIAYTDDTLINNKLCNKLVPVNYQFTSDQYYHTIFLGADTMTSQYTYVNGDTVFYFINNKFHVLYNFGAKPGDTWDLGVDTNEFKCSKSIAKVDSIGKIVINSVSYRWISLSAETNSSVGWNGKIVERFGAMDHDMGNHYLFPMFEVCNGSIVDGGFYGFSCFQDDNFSLYNTNNTDCEYLLSTGIAISSKKPLEIYPIPTNDKLYISKEANDEFLIRIYSQTGKEIYSKKTAESEVDLSAFDNGIYFLKIEDKDHNTVFKRIVKIK